MVDVDVINAFLNVKQKYEQYLANVEYVKSYSTDDTIVVTLKGIKSVPRNVLQEIENSLREALGKKVRVIEYTNNINELATQLAQPARILTVAISWLPDGTSEAVVKITRFEARRLPFKPDEFARIQSMISGTTVKVEITRS